MTLDTPEILGGATLEDTLRQLTEMARGLESLAFDMALDFDSEIVVRLLHIVMELERFLEAFPQGNHDLMPELVTIH